MTTSARPVCLSGSIVLTLPTGTPEMRTSASCASCGASANEAGKREPCGLSGVLPPNASHRNSSRPKHDRANPAMTATRPKEGAAFCISASASAEGVLARGRAVLLGQVQQAGQDAQQGVGLLDLVEDRDVLAGRDEEAAADRAVRVLGGEELVADVVRPRDPEEVALLLARRVVGEHVEQRVDDRERPPQVRRGGREVARGGAQLADGGA